MALAEISEQRDDRGMSFEQAAAAQQDASAIEVISAMLDPVLGPLGFATGQAGVSGDTGQVIFCRGDVDGIDDGCVDLVIDVARSPTWRVVDVRYWGFTNDRWHLSFLPDADLPAQLEGLALTLPGDLR